MDSSIHPEAENQGPTKNVHDEEAAQHNSTSHIVTSGAMCLRRVKVNFKRLIKGTEPKSRSDIQSN